MKKKIFVKIQIWLLYKIKFFRRKSSGRKVEVLHFAEEKYMMGKEEQHLSLCSGDLRKSRELEGAENKVEKKKR